MSAEQVPPGWARPWQDDESSCTEDVRLFAALVARGCGRPLTIALMVTAAAALTYLLLLPRDYRATAYLRLSERELSGANQAVGKTDLRGWLDSAVLTRKSLLRVASDNQLYRAKAAIGPGALVESFRDDIELGVASNYFLLDRGSGTKLRSAHLSISYRAATPVVAEQVARQLAATAIDYQRQQTQWRSVQIRQLVESQRHPRARASALLLGRGSSPEWSLEVTSIDYPTPFDRSRAGQVAAVVGVLLLPFAAFLAGVFDPKIRNLEDLRGQRAALEIPAQRGSR